ncbi:hypothetical protein K1T71_012604 [Dendrolimus kikuchii]|uniref:Uncharacterized protein n=1 Tax=Dendrolimus kikuchii TaxID=765133 RepID=A0ACC1CJT6_9NEOP|nr:hypothetical protein K1T71_012604 [Dendrolimus kikuchii]
MSFPIMAPIKRLFVDNVRIMAAVLLLVRIICFHKTKAEYYDRLQQKYGFVDPYQLHEKEPIDLDKIKDCRCPRVIWPIL